MLELPLRCPVQSLLHYARLVRLLLPGPSTPSALPPEPPTDRLTLLLYEATDW
jgi:hypothetical protein